MKRFGFKRRVPIRLQMDVTECGAACLAMVLSYFGRDTSVREARERCAIGRDGMTADILVRAARGFGMQVRALSLPHADLSGLALPAIVHWNFSHFIVVERWSKDHFAIVDPALGRARVSIAEFEAGFTGVVLMLAPGESFKPARAGNASFWRDYLRRTLQDAGVHKALMQLLVVSILLQTMAVAVPLLFGALIDRLTPGGAIDPLQSLGLAMVCLVAAQSIAMFARARLLLFVEAKLDFAMLPTFMRHLLALPLDFFQRYRNGDLLLRLGNNVIVRDALASQALGLLLDATLLIACVAALMFTDPVLGGIALAVAALQTLLLAFNMAPLRRLADREVNAVAESQSYATEALNAVASIKASGAEARLLSRWTTLFHRYRQAAYDRSWRAAQVDTAINSMRLLAPAMLLWFGAQRVAEGALTIGGLLTASMLAASLFAPLTAILGAAQRMQTAKVHLDRIVDVRASTPERVAPSDQNSVRLPLTGRIELRDVDFKFDPHSPLTLTGIRLAIRPGQKVALVGRTGSGKSTLAMLLLGLYKPTAGRVLFDGVDLSYYDLHALRRQIGVVMQETGMLSGSIRQNIAFFDGTMPLTAVIDAARRAEIHDDILRMPMGYETLVADGGAGLSGGQRQRLCLARALARNPAILLLDEATSHLDVATEAAVDRNLDALNCTRIVIAHRLSTIRNADVIVVLDRGRVVAVGPHAQLAEDCAEYAQLVNAQSMFADRFHAQRVAVEIN